MSNVLVAYGSKHGATAEIAEAVADELRKRTHGRLCARGRRR
jgi:flavodoxin